MDDAFAEMLRSVSESLDAFNVPYAVTGSIASSIHGEPLASQDVDICLRMSAEQAGELAKRLPDRFYRSASALREAAQTHGMANLIDTNTGLKVDLSFLAPGAFHDSVLARRAKITYSAGPSAFWVVSPEDVILMKLVWRRETRSDKQWENALSVAKVRRVALDWAYMNNWSSRLGVENDMDRLRRDAGL